MLRQRLEHPLRGVHPEHGPGRCPGTSSNASINSVVSVNAMFTMGYGDWIIAIAAQPAGDISQGLPSPSRRLSRRSSLRSYGHSRR